MIYFKSSDAPPDKVLYAFAYFKTNSKEKNGLIAMPYKCILKIRVENYSNKDYEFGYCFKVKKNGETSKSSVNFESRCYTDSYIEAVEGFNILVDKVNNELENLIKLNKKDKIQL